MINTSKILTVVSHLQLYRCLEECLTRMNKYYLPHDFEVDWFKNLFTVRLLEPGHLEED